MKEKVLIPNRGVVTLDIIYSLKNMGLETIVLSSPEDWMTMPVKMADRSYKFFSSKLKDSYLDIDTIVEKAVELKVDYIHPGYGFLSEEPEFAQKCVDNGIKFIGPDPDVLRIAGNKVQLKKIAESAGLNVIKFSEPFHSVLDSEDFFSEIKFPAIVKPVKGLAGIGIKVVKNKKEAEERISDILKREKYRKDGVFAEEFADSGNQIEIPFCRDHKGNVFFYPEIESSIQRRFQKILQESPSENITPAHRDQLYKDCETILSKISYTGYGHCEFILKDEEVYFQGINPTYQINTLMPEYHSYINTVKIQIALANGAELENVTGTEIIKPERTVFLASLMAENPYDNFQPSAGIVKEFYYYTHAREMIKTHIHTGSKISSQYDPYIGKMLTSGASREECINNLKTLLDSVFVRGINTNICFLKELISTKDFIAGKTNINFIKDKFDFNASKSDEKMLIAAAILGSEFHIENRRKNLKAKLESMKQPGFLKKILSNFMR